MVFVEEFSDHFGDAWCAEDASDVRFFAVFFDVGDVHSKLVDGADGCDGSFDFDDNRGVVFVDGVEVDGSGADGFFSFDDAESGFDEAGVADDVVDDVGFHA